MTEDPEGTGLRPTYLIDLTDLTPINNNYNPPYSTWRPLSVPSCQPPLFTSPHLQTSICNRQPKPNENKKYYTKKSKPSHMKAVNPLISVDEALISTFRPSFIAPIRLVPVPGARGRASGC